MPRHGNRKRQVEEYKPRGWTSTADLEETLKAMFGRNPTESAKSETPGGIRPGGDSPEPHGSTVIRPLQISSSEEKVTERPGGLSPAGVSLPNRTFYFEGVGYRRPYFCRTAQDGHSPFEQVLYEYLWKKASVRGTREPSGSFLVAASMSELEVAFHTDRKHLKTMLGSLIAKLAIEAERKPDFRRQVPGRYRIFSYAQILERRKDAGLVWAVRNRAVQFLPIDVIARLASETPGGLTPGGESLVETEPPGGVRPGGLSERPAGLNPERPGGVGPPVLRNISEGNKFGEETTTTAPAAVRYIEQLAMLLNAWIRIDNDGVQLLWQACRQGTADCTPEEVNEFARTKASVIHAGKLENPTGFLINSVPKFFANGGGEALKQYRAETRRRREEEERRQEERRELLRRILNDPNAAEEDKEWARQALSDQSVADK